MAISSRVGKAPRAGRCWTGPWQAQKCSCWCLASLRLVCEGGHRGSPVVLRPQLSSPNLIFLPRSDHLPDFLLHPNLLTAVSFQMGLGWVVRPGSDILLGLSTPRMFSMSFALWPWPVAMSAIPATRPTSLLLVRTWREGQGWGLGALSPLNLDTGPPLWLLVQAWRSTHRAPSCQASCHSPYWLACWAGSAS